jgi:hypothetical protein
MNKKLLFLTLLSIATIAVSAQKFKPAPSFLKGQTEVNVVFDFSKTTFDGDAQKAQYKAKGKAWVAEWEGKRRADIIAEFAKSANEALQQSGLSLGEYAEAEYTIIVKVDDCDFGAYSGPFSVPAKLKCTVSIVKTGLKNTLATVALKAVQNRYAVLGTPVDFDRMFMAFTAMGQSVGEKLVKVVK